MPSPASLTVPTSSREAASGSYDWTKVSSASRISSGRIVSSAIVGSLLSLFSVVVRGSGGLRWCWCSAGQRRRDVVEPADTVPSRPRSPTWTRIRRGRRVHVDVEVHPLP